MPSFRKDPGVAWATHGLFGAHRSRGLRLAVILSFLFTATVSIGGEPTAEAAASPDRPNVLIILADDQTWSTFGRPIMPSVYREIVDKGALFKRAYSSSLCCPSRSEIFTGLYQHHTGVDSNDVQLKRPTLAKAAQDLGYRTIYSGKYMNSMPCDPRAEFDQWMCTGRPPGTHSLKNPTMNVDGTWQSYAGYTVQIMSDYAAQAIASTAPDQPFFAIYSPPSPHLPANDDRYSKMPVSPLRTPSYNEETRTSDKPEYMQRPPLTPDEVKDFDGYYQKMVRSSRGLDDSVGSLLASLGDRADDTIVFYMSDNGFLYGQHRRAHKLTPYEEAINVPMAVRYPPLLSQAFESQALVQGIDIVPTIADLMNIHWGADGKSLVPLLTGAATSIRDAVLTEYCQAWRYPCPGGHPSYLALQKPVPSYWEIVTATHKLVEYETGEAELYNLSTDPHELNNLAGDAATAGLQSQLSDRLRDLHAPPPVDTTIVTGPQGPISTRAVTFTYFSQSRFSTYRCRLIRNGVPQGWQPCGYEAMTLGSLVDGNYVFEVAGTDEHGNTDATPATRSFSVSSTGPDVTINSAPPAHQKAKNVSFGFSSSTAGAWFQCRIGLFRKAAAWKSCSPSTGASYGPLADGLYSFEVRAVKSTGKTEPPAQWLFRIDNVGPTPVYDKVPLKTVGETEEHLMFHPNETSSGPFTCSLDGASPVDCSNGSFEASGLSEGNHALAITLTDVLGNTKTSSYTWKVDLTPPVASIVNGPSGVVSSRSATFTFGSNEPIGGFFCQLDGGPSWYCGKSITYTGLSEGDHTLSVKGYDPFRNVSSPVSRSWTVDIPAP